MIGSGAAINSAAGQSGYALGVIFSSFLVTALSDNVYRSLLQTADLPGNVATQLDSAWQSVFARAMSGNLTNLPPDAAQWVTAHFAPAFTTGLAQTVLIMAGVVAGVAIFIFVGMERGLKGSFITPPDARPRLLSHQALT